MCISACRRGLGEETELYPVSRSGGCRGRRSLSFYKGEGRREKNGDPNRSSQIWGREGQEVMAVEISQSTGAVIRPKPSGEGEEI